jgi:hypothetical protein
MGIAAFGPGIAIVTRTDVTPSTPINAGYCQSLSLNFKGTTKKLYGQNQYPLVTARSVVDPTGKIVSAVDSGIAVNSMFFGSTFTAGGYIWNIGEADTVPATSTYTITVTNGGTFDQDLGVVYTNTLLPLQKVSSLTAIGQYTVNPATGVYTFFSGDASAAVSITYTSTVTTPGQNMIVTNQPIGFTPTFQLDYYTKLNQPSAKTLIYRVYACIADSLAFDYKLEDFALPSFDFTFFANAAGQVVRKIYSEVS